MARIYMNLVVRAERRRWFAAAFTLLAWTCAIAGIASDRLADWLSDCGACVLARYGFRYSVHAE
jgi:hypothetical protein